MVRNGENGPIRVPKHALIVPDCGHLRLGAPIGCYSGGGGDAVTANGSRDISATEEEAVGGTGGGVVEAVGGGGGERGEEVVEVGLERGVRGGSGGAGAVNEEESGGGDGSGPEEGENQEVGDFDVLHRGDENFPAGAWIMGLNL